MEEEKNAGVDEVLKWIFGGRTVVFE